MLVGLKNKDKPAFIPKALFTIYGRSSDSLLEVCRLPETLVFSGILTDFKSLQQRELSGIFTRFPIKPPRHQKSLQKYKKKLHARHHLQNGLKILHLKNPNHSN